MELGEAKWDTAWSRDTTVDCNLTGKLSIAVSLLSPAKYMTTRQSTDKTRRPTRDH